MPTWTYNITIMNDTDHKLKLVSSSIPWGKKSAEFPKIINPGESGDFSVYSPAGVPTGIEFYFTMKDIPNKPGEPNYGSFSFSLDMPFWKHENKSSLDCTGMLIQDGFKKIPDGAHDFATAATISTTLMGNNDSETDTVCGGRYDWNDAERLKTVNPDEVVIDAVIPEKNLLISRKTVLRTEVSPVARNMWNQIKDAKFPDAHSKNGFVSNYFTVMIYEIRKNKTVSIAANQSYNKVEEITNRSTVRREVRQDFQIENIINASGGAGEISLEETLRVAYQISDLKEYCDESIKTVREEFIYDATDCDRNVVLWDLVRVLALYRKDKKGSIELIGIDDYYVDDVQKTYIGNGNDAASDLVFECANSQEIYNDEDDEYEQSDVNAIQGRICINGINYRWCEASFGTNRGMLFNPGRHRYKFTPNPHNDPYYNKNQVRWYSEMAEQFRRAGNAGNWTQDEWPGNIRNLNVHGESYTASI